MTENLPPIPPIRPEPLLPPIPMFVDTYRPEPLLPTTPPTTPATRVEFREVDPVIWVSAGRCSLPGWFYRDDGGHCSLMPEADDDGDWAQHITTIDIWRSTATIQDLLRELPAGNLIIFYRPPVPDTPTG